MSINALFQPNDYNLYCHSINSATDGPFQSPVTIEGSATADTFLNLNTDNVTPQSIQLQMGNSTGHYTIQRTGNNKELSLFQVGDSTNTNLVLTLGTGLLYNNSGMFLLGQFRDSLNSAGSAGQVLISTGTAVEWSTSAAQSQIFLNSSGIPLNTGFIGQAGFTNTGADASYSFAKASSIVGIFVQINAAPGAGTWDFNVQKDGVNSALSVSMTGVTTQASATGSIAYNAGDNYTLAVTKTGAPPAVSACFVTLIYQ